VTAYDAMGHDDDALVTRIREDAAAGPLRPDVDAEGVVSPVLGAYLGELVRRGRVSDDWMDRCLGVGRSRGSRGMTPAPGTCGSQRRTIEVSATRWPDGC